MSAAENWAEPVGTTRRRRPRSSAASPGRRLARWTMASSVDWHRTTSASAWASTSRTPPPRSGKQPADVDHHIRVEGTERLGDDRPGLLVGDGLVHASQTEQHGEAPGEMVDVVPDVLGDEGAPCRGEERGQAAGGGHGVAGSEVTAEGIGLDQEDLAALRPAGGQGGGRRGHPRRALDGGEGDDGHFVLPSLTRERPIWSAAA